LEDVSKPFILQQNALYLLLNWAQMV